MDYEKEKEMIEETNCEEVNKKIRASIDRIIEKFKGNHQAWKDERQVHYDFFKFLFDVFSAEEIKRNFVWEYRYRVGGSTSETIDLVMFCGNRNMVAVDFKLPKSLGKGIKENLIKHIKIQSNYIDSLFRGYVVPLYYHRDGQAAAQKQNHDMTIRELSSKVIKQAKESIKDPRIELIEAGIILERP